MRLEELDERIQAGTDWVKVTFERVEYWHAILFVIANGCLVGMATTGFLEDKSIEPISLPGALYFINFFMMLLILTVKISPTSRFLMKIVTMAVLGYALFWQVGAELADIKGFDPLADHPFMAFLFYSLSAGAAVWAFNGNDQIERVDDELEELRRELADAKKQLAEVERSNIISMRG